MKKISSLNAAQHIVFPLRKWLKPAAVLVSGNCGGFSTIVGRVTCGGFLSRSRLSSHLALRRPCVSE